MMKKSITKTSCLLATALVVSTPVAYADSPHEFSANIAISSDYLFRGISQTDGGPAVSGGFDYSYTPWGLYAGTWASSIEFNDGSPVEIDYYGGFAGEFASTGIGWDIGAIYYDYPQGDDTALGADLEYIEAYGGLSYTFAAPWDPTIGAFVAYSPDFFGETGDAVAVEGTLDLSLPIWDLGLGFLIGHQDVDDIGEYHYWSVGLSKDISIFTFDVTYSGTGDTDDDFCAGGLDLCDDTVVFSVSSSF